ncbi:fungal specific transcription factor domain-containing protein [Colletotrichum plurivorum]|uniref:Fungal specific transcription factor domain-containing protein n=1 Tax=Colletotrichum plurivorum TaxID=2175906 RepID=A0A8H6N071_9PEZI|nr:fungal specific transcription factor domain-containing protein [Colletotrichum plurivorum]
MTDLLLTPRDRFASGAKAAQACGSCKRQKRKCDKALPACGLCSRMDRHCDYAEPQLPAPTADDFAALQLKLLELESRLNGAGAVPASSASGSGPGPAPIPAPDPGPGPLYSSAGNGDGIGPGLVNDTPPAATAYTPLEPLWEQPQTATQFPPDVFLDISTFESMNQPAHRPFIEIPAEVLQYLGDDEQVQRSATTYFATVHPWLPIVSKKRMNMGVALSQGGPDLAMLFLAMKLVTSTPAAGVGVAQSPLYRAAKRFASLLEHGGASSLMALQSMALIAYFEHGHAIYPAAWITIGSCVRYAEFLGLPDFHEGNVLLSSATTWTEAEERKRTWWGILILDRFICIGNKKRYISPDPEANETFPSDDESWDQGRVDRAIHHPVSSPVSTKLTPFSALCRAALQAGRVTIHVRDASTRNRNKSPGPPESRIHEAIFLSLTLSSATASLPKDLPFLAPRCVAFSALILLHDHYCCPGNQAGHQRDSPEAEHQLRSIEELRVLCCTISKLADEILALDLAVEGDAGADVGIISPLVLDALYGAANTLAWLVRENGSQESVEAFASINRCLEKLGQRWRLAGEYVRMLGQQHLAYMMQDQGYSTIRMR